jgi:hypothetical protein
MELDPGMHIVMHLVFFGKTGVTPSDTYHLPKCCLKSSSRLGDPVTNLGRCSREFEIFVSVHTRIVRVLLADSPRPADSSLTIGRLFCGPLIQRRVLRVREHFCTADSPPMLLGQSSIQKYFRKLIFAEMVFFHFFDLCFR